MSKIEQLFFTKKPGLSDQYSRFWLAIALGFSLLYSAIALREAFSGNYIVQDDARQHVFWMSRFLDDSLFPQDLIADYFQSVAPMGYKLIYAVPAQFGLDPFITNKILPSILGIITTFYCYLLTMELLPIPFTGFVATLLLNQNLWLQDGLVSATPKAFAIPLLLAFLYYYLKRSLSGTCITIFLLGFFYPSLVFICSGLLVLYLWKIKDNFLKPRDESLNNYIFCMTGLFTGFLVLLPYAISVSEFAPTITVSQARMLPDFARGGRSFFFDDQNPFNFWLGGSRSGLRFSAALMPPSTYFAVLLPLILKAKHIFPLGHRVTPKVKALGEIVLVSLVMFGLAHLLLFRLYLPSRYTQNSLRIVIAIASSISITLIAHSLSRTVANRMVKTYFLRSRLAKYVLIVLGVFIIMYPHATSNFVWTHYEQGKAVALYEFLQRQPKDTMVASLTSEADNLPSFTRRSILASQEYAIPYHTAYYFPYRQRVINLINASYSSNLETLQRFIRQYQVNFFLTEKASFTLAYITNNPWLQQHQTAAEDAISSLKQNKIPALRAYQDGCTVLQVQKFKLISAECILNAQS